MIRICLRRHDVPAVSQMLHGSTKKEMNFGLVGFELYLLSLSHFNSF